MLVNAKGIHGYTITANDGRLGTVSDLLFDDASWLVRWLVVDTGKWLPLVRSCYPSSFSDTSIQKGASAPFD